MLVTLAFLRTGLALRGPRRDLPGRVLHDRPGDRPDQAAAAGRGFAVAATTRPAPAPLAGVCALAVEVNLFRHLQHSATPPGPRRTHTTRLTSPSNTAISVWPLADPLRDWEVLT